MIFFSRELTYSNDLSAKVRELYNLTEDGMKLNLNIYILARIQQKLSGFRDCGLLGLIFLGITVCGY